MTQPRAADDFEAIRARLQELQRERRPVPPSIQPDAPPSGHRGPCACGMSLFPDECDGYCKAL